MMKLYRCFSGKQNTFLLNKGLKYLLKAKDFHTDKTFWLYEKTELMDMALTEWSENRNNLLY